MTVKISIDIDERYRAFAERQVEDGLFPSVSSVIEAGIAQMMMDGDGGADPLEGMKDEIRRRLELPADQWIPWDGDEMFRDIQAMIGEREKAQRS